MQSLYLLALDRHHLGDALFLKSLAQQFAGAEDAPSCLIVHGSGEKVERTLEAQGYFPERTDGLLEVETDEQRRLVERAVREVNQELVATLTDEVVSAVGIQGVDRGLFQKEAGGSLQAGGVGWISALIKQHVVPVVSALVESPETGYVQEVPTEAAAIALARVLDASFDPTVCVFTTAETAGLPGEDGNARADAPVDAVSEEHVPEPRVVRCVSDRGIPVLVTSPQGLFFEDGVRGTRIHSGAK